ncbi:recombinase family protein [Endozoicomonas sp. SESOKO1]|uniref:recombinase family protein n=1 Tax=Endozoicomonas sp. SESOKO1 TaxID=2828742 RepID=UPI0021478E50|nr:recombinase family protein [Endozoicomonas sp. SESOKO1]
MTRIFAYCRVSTTEQTTANQILAINNAGFNVEPHRVVTETISGSTMAMQRANFKKLVEDRMEAGDTLLVLKLDRLGRDMIDVLSILELLASKEIAVISLDLGNINLNSPAGKLQVQVMAAVAEFERNRIRERTKEGLERAKAEGKALGRPSLDQELQDKVVELRASGLSISETGKALNISVSSVKRLQARAKG